MSLRAVIFDVDGTLSDTERDGHRPAFNDAFAAHGLDVVWNPDYYGELLAITGGRRRIAHDLQRRGYEATADRLAAAVHATKTELFRERVLAGSMPARPGLTELVSGLRRAGVRIAVATTGTRAWVEPLVEDLLGVVEVVVTGDDVARLKPDPEVYHRALHVLELDREQVLAVEDSAVGLRASLGAGIATIVVSNGYTAGQDFHGAVAVRTAFDLPDPLTAEACRQIHAAATH